MEIIAICVTVGMLMAVIFLGAGIVIGRTYERMDKGKHNDDSDICGCYLGGNKLDNINQIHNNGNVNRGCGMGYNPYQE